MNRSYWLWYPGDFEIYQALLQNFSREERGMGWPAFWYQDDCHKNVNFRRRYELREKTSFTVYSHSSGYVQINGKKRRFGVSHVLEPGTVNIEIVAGQVTGLPAVYIEGEVVCSDPDWEVTAFDGKYFKAGYSERYTKKEQDPSLWEYDTEIVYPVRLMEMEGGVLYDFNRELTAVLKPTFPKGFREIKLCYGESVEEATDVEMCYHSHWVTAEHGSAEEAASCEPVLGPIPMNAFRYVFIPDCSLGEVDLTAHHQFVDIPVKASFSCSDELLDRIWQVSKETFRLCSGVFFIDGIKRDRWIWSGDAYQSYLVNPYLFFDESINRRTILGLRGSDPIRGQINTILDYSMYWVISVYNHYQMSGDLEFVKMIWPKVMTMMEFLEGQLDEHGFILGRPGDWIFIDWSEMDKDGALCAEQMLLAVCYRTMSGLTELLGEDGECWRAKYGALMEQIEKYFWCEEKGAYIDSFSSGKNHVTRHANIFAILFDLVEEKRKELLYESVLCNDAVTAITTPYFKFYELEVLCRLGKKEKVLEEMKSYWGGILAQDAVTIWEEFDPNVKGRERFAMYDDPYGKSLCHAWGANPIYLIGRYFLGVEPASVAYETFRVKPDTDLLSDFDCVVPIKDGEVRMKWDKMTLSVTASRAGGRLFWKGSEHVLEAGRTLVLSAK